MAPVFGMLGWVSGAAFQALCAALVWQVVTGAELEPGLVVARTLWILLALVLCAGLVWALELWLQLLGHAIDNYRGHVVFVLAGVATLAGLAVAALWLWVVSWPLQAAWPPLARFGTALLPAAADSGSAWPPWLAWPALAAASGVVLVFLWSEARHLARQLVDAHRLLGCQRAWLGALLMLVLRHRLPRRDLFMLSPVLAPLPLFALAALLWSVIGVPVVAWALPLAILLAALLFAANLLAPPLWLFLGQSGFGSFAAFWGLRAVWRKNGLTLLNRVGWGGVAFYAAWRAAVRLPPWFFDPSVPRAWSLRTREAWWQDSVLLLMDFVRVVVVDVRGASDIVRDELDWLQQRDRRSKAWYLVDGEASISPAERAAVVSRYPLVDGSRLVTQAMLASATWTPSGLSFPAPPRDGAGAAVSAQAG